MSLKDITKDLHTEAEKTEFAKLLLSGNISTEQYVNYLYQMLLVYGPIEFGCDLQGFFKNLPDIKRTASIFDDFKELDGFNLPHKWISSTIKYHNYLLDLINDPDRKHLIKAHLYVRHMGDLFGGQYIAKKVPGSGKFYQFKDVETLKLAIRNELTDDLGDEARIAFQWAIDIMNELHE